MDGILSGIRLFNDKQNNSKTSASDTKFSETEASKNQEKETQAHEAGSKKKAAPVKSHRERQGQSSKDKADKKSSTLGKNLAGKNAGLRSNKSPGLALDTENVLQKDDRDEINSYSLDQTDGSNVMKSQTDKHEPISDSVSSLGTQSYGSRPPSIQVKEESVPLPSAVIGSKITFKGELSGEEDLFVQGKVEGSITLQGNHLIIGKLGDVKANLHAKTITIDGRVEGDMIGEERIEINASSNVKGNIVAERVTLEDGAKFKGSIDMDLDSTTAAKSKSTTASAPSSGSASAASANTNKDSQKENK